MDGGAAPPYTLHNQVRTSVAADRNGTKARRTADSIERACRAKGLRITGPRRVIARVIGETAPILVTAGFASAINWNVFSGWMSTLPTLIYYQILTPTSPTNTDPSTQRAWAAALLLILMVMLLNLAARLIARMFAPKTSR